MDKSNGYEDIAASFSKSRTQAIGASSVRCWTKTLPPKATVLDLGCGTGLPVSKVLIEEGIHVYGIDASPTLVRTFQQNFRPRRSSAKGSMPLMDDGDET